MAEHGIAQLSNHQTWYERVTRRESDFSQVYTRMDIDRDLRILKTFRFLDEENNEIKELDVLTDNAPCVFANQVLATLGAANMQTIVEAQNLNDKETTYIEEWLRDILLYIDDKLPIRISSLYEFAVEQSALRGRIAAKCLIRYDQNDEFQCDVRPVDTRHISYEESNSSFDWIAATRYRTSDMIAEEYGDLLEKEHPSYTLKEGRTIEIRDIWTADENIIYIDNVEAIKQKHDYGKVPWIYEMVSVGTQFEDQETFGHEGESIFFANRQIEQDFNKMASILHSLNISSFLGGMQYESSTGKSKKPQRPPYGKRFVVPVEKGMGYKAMPLQDIKNATKLLFAMLSTSRQRGALPNVDYGSINFPLSAVAISKLSANRDKIYIPRMEALSRFYRDLSIMIKEQFIDAGIDEELGQDGYRVKYDLKRLDVPYNVSYKFFAQNQEQVIANLAIADAAKDHVSEDHIRRNIMRLEDPDGEKQKMDEEAAERLSPAIKTYKMLLAKIETNEDIEARILFGQLKIMLPATSAPLPPAPQEVTPTRSENRTGVPLLGAEQVGAGRVRNREEEEPREPTEEGREGRR